MPVIEMFFDHTCPYCYRGHKLLMAMLPRFPGVMIQWRPIEAHPKPEEPWHTPYEDLAVQGALFARDSGLDERLYHERLYRAQFDERRPIDALNTLTACAAEVGLDAAAFRQAIESGRYADAQAAANVYAYEQNKVWAVPTFVCGAIRLDATEGVGVSEAQLRAFLVEVTK